MSRTVLLMIGIVLCVSIWGCRETPPPPAQMPSSPAAAAETAGYGGKGDWCAGHGIPESMCTKCNPSLIAGFKASGDWCAGHGFPESVCPLCNPLPPPSADGVPFSAVEGRTVRLASPGLEEAAGIRSVTARLVRSAPGVECPVRIAFDSDRIADVRSTVPGLVRRVFVRPGDTVKPGEALFELESARVGEVQGVWQTARERVRAARINLDRLRELRRDDVASARQVEIAEQELAAAKAQAETAETMLRLAGAPRAAPAGSFTLTAPLGGTVVERPAVVGLLAAEATSLATIADTSVMWAFCHVLEADASRIALGDRVRLTVDGGDRVVEGEIAWIAAAVDPRTRTVTARADVPNPDGRLRANQFGRALIETGAAVEAVTVPRAAVQRVGDEEVVFVRLAEGLYESRAVQRLGSGELVRVAGRVAPGEAVVTTGAVFLRTEMMPGSIGAGCCDVLASGGE
jgi:cobalt-zinc-cadmium efflux system membrane fusion protein